MDGMHIGKHYLPTVDTRFNKEDHMASSGIQGVSGYGESPLAPGEAQARGFEHAHDKKTALPKTQTTQYHILRDSASHCDNQQSEADPLANQESDTNKIIKELNNQLIDYATSRQYESSILPGRQFGLMLPPSLFSALQQKQSKYDGEMEADEKTKRDLVEVVESEPPAHPARGKNHCN